MLLKLIYEAFRVLVWVSTPLFYTQLTVLRRELLRQNTPGFVVSNHPSTLLDPLNAVSRLPFQVKFLANYGIFTTWLTNWLFRTLYCIPVKRRIDVGGVGPLDNSEAFAAATQYLANGGHLYMAPEGGCLTYRSLQPMKSGIARIARAFIQQHPDKPLFVWPIGLCYWHPFDFRQRLLIQPGTPINTVTILQQAESPEVGQRQLLEAIQIQLAELTIDASDEQQSDALYTLESVAHAPADILDVPLTEQFRTAKWLLTGLQSLAQNHPLSYRMLCEKCQLFDTALHTHGLYAHNLETPSRQRWSQLFFGTLAMPMLAVVMLLTIFPQGFSSVLPSWMRTHLSYYPTYRYVAKTFLLPLTGLVLAGWAFSVGGWPLVGITLAVYVAANLLRTPLYNEFKSKTMPNWRFLFLPDPNKQELLKLYADLKHVVGGLKQLHK